MGSGVEVRLLQNICHGSAQSGYVTIYLFKCKPYDPVVILSLGCISLTFILI